MPADGNIIHLPTPPLRVAQQEPGYGFPPVEEMAERYQLRGWAHGYAIYDRGDLICTFHGPQFDLASKTLRLLQEDVQSAHPGTHETQRAAPPSGAVTNHGADL